MRPPQPLPATEGATQFAAEPDERRLAPVAIEPERGQHAHAFGHRRHRRQLLSMLDEVAPHAHEHGVAVALLEWLLQPGAIEIDEQGPHAVAAPGADDVVEVQVRVPQSGREGQAQQRAHGRGRDAALGGVGGQERRQRQRVGDALGTQPQPPVDAVPATDGRDRRDRRHTFGAQAGERLDLAPHALWADVAILEQPTQRAAAPARPHDQLAVTDAQQADTAAALDALERRQFAPERLEADVGEIGDDPAKARSLALFDESLGCSHAAMIGLDCSAAMANARFGAMTTTTPARTPATAALPHGARVLVIRLSALGDVLFALETVAALHRERPDLVIDFLVEDRFAALLEGHPQIAEVLVYPRRHRLRIPGSLLRLRRRDYACVIDLHGIQKSALHVRFLKSPLKIGPDAPAAREGAQRVYHRAVPMPSPLPHRADIGHALLAALGLSGEPAPPLFAALDPGDALPAGAAAPVLLFPGTSAFAAFKRWPGDRFAELARRLHDRRIPLAIAFGPGERELAAPALQAVPTADVIDGGELGLRRLAGVFARCAVVVAADTGPLHLAAAMGARCVALFGPKDPTRYGPRGHGGITHEVLYHDVPCQPCRRRDCVTPQCVLGIAVDTVEAAVMRQLEAARK